MAKQTFTTGQVLTAAQMTSLQQTAMGGGSATAKTANYVLVAADAGTTVAMNAAGATTITVNTGLFTAGDTVLIQNLGAGVCTVTAGTATVSTAGSLALVQYQSGILYFTATGAAIFNNYVQAGGGGSTFVGCQVTTNSTDQATSNTVNYKVQFMAEDFDTDGFHDNVTNNTRITIPSGKGGYYLVYGLIHWLNNTSGRRIVYISKNNTTQVQAEGFSVATNTQYPANQVASVYNLAAGDYVELEAFQSSGGNLSLECEPSTTKFGAYKIG
jgi:hypothetical protein